MILVIEIVIEESLVDTLIKEINFVQQYIRRSVCTRCVYC